MPEYVRGPLTRDRLREVLDQRGIDTRTYNLYGSHGNEGYVLAQMSGGGWAAFYAERGQERDRQEFSTEDGACGWLLDRLLGLTPGR